jgi:uncharacterized protein YjiS (DUF1127 family)
VNVATHDIMMQCQAFSHSSPVSGGGFAARIARTVGIWRSRIRERQAFANLDCRDMRDFGVSRWEVEHELAKPFWRG